MYIISSRIVDSIRTHCSFLERKKDSLLSKVVSVVNNLACERQCDVDGEVINWAPVIRNQPNDPPKIKAFTDGLAHYLGEIKTFEKCRWIAAFTPPLKKSCKACLTKNTFRGKCYKCDDVMKEINELPSSMARLEMQQEHKQNVSQEASTSQKLLKVQQIFDT